MSTFIGYIQNTNIKAYGNVTFFTYPCSYYYGFGLLSFFHQKDKRVKRSPLRYFLRFFLISLNNWEGAFLACHPQDPPSPERFIGL